MKTRSKLRLAVVAAVAVASVAVPAAIAGTYTFTGSITTGDVHQTNRLDRNGIATTCNMFPYKANPGTFPDAASYADVYDFTNLTQPQCVTVRLTPHCGVNFATFVGGYDGYTPADPSLNWLGDPGVSAADSQQQVFQFPVAANSHFQVVVQSVSSNSSTCAFYSLTVSYGKIAKSIAGGSGVASAAGLAPGAAWDHR